MVLHSADKIIQSIAQVTRHSDRELLEASLASTLYELLNLAQVSLYHVYPDHAYYEDKQSQLYLGIEIIEGEMVFHDLSEVLNVEALNNSNGLQQCLQTKQAVISTAADNQFCYSYPITNHLNEIASIFCLTGKERYSQADERFIAGYFQIYRNYLRLLDESEHDTLTGLLNRRTYDSKLDKILAEQHKEQDAIDTMSANKTRRHAVDKRSDWLAVIDIDHFKKVNDRYGHIYGDEVLLLLAKIMRESFRVYDKLFRFGGEEFVVILRTTDQAGVARVLERFRSTIAAYSFGQIGTITISIGFIEIVRDAIPTQIFGLADEALYYAKHHGRNRVCQYEQLVEAGELSNVEKDLSNDIEIF